MICDPRHTLAFFFEAAHRHENQIYHVDGTGLKGLRRRQGGSTSARVGPGSRRRRCRLPLPWRCRERRAVRLSVWSRIFRTTSRCGCCSMGRKSGDRISTITQFAAIPEEQIWLAKQKSPRTRRAYRFDVQHFMRTLGSQASRNCARPTRGRIPSQQSRDRMTPRPQAGSVALCPSVTSIDCSSRARSR